jgi:hypothetical protein
MNTEINKKIEDILKKISKFHFNENGIDLDYEKGDIFIRKEDWLAIKQRALIEADVNVKLVKELEKPIDSLDELIVCWNLKEIKMAVQNILNEKNDTIKSLEEAKKSYDDEIREKDKLLFELAHEKGNYSGQIINLKNELSNKDDEMKKNTPRLIIKDTDVRDIDKTADICIKLLQPIFGTLYVEKIFGDAQLKEEKGK